MTSNIQLYQGDCLEVMKNIPDRSVDLVLTDPYVVELYSGGMTMRQIAKLFNTNHKLISRILKKEGVVTRPSNNTRYARKFKCRVERNYNNMLKHLRFDVDIKWLMRFDNFDKMKFLNRVLTNRDKRWEETSVWYISYIEKFYFDKQFNLLYDRWNKSGCKPYMKPSIDHITPKAKGGTNALDNLQFLTWFENRCKNDMSQEDWDKMKSNILEYFV